MYPAGDAELIQIVDSALADATRRAGAWLACKPGCSQCCTGVFRISQLDGARLREGLQLLRGTNTVLAATILQRIELARTSLASSFPGNAVSGLLSEEDDARDAFENFAEDAVCPVLDPQTETCSLYDYRPMTCRTFGPPVWTADEGLGVCELCFQGAPPEAVEHSRVHLPAPDLEEQLTELTGAHGETIVAFAFAEQGLL